MRENVPLAPLTTFGIGGRAERYLEIESEAALQAVAHEMRNGFAVLGGGSNVLVPDYGVAGIVSRVQLAGIDCTEDSTGTVRVVAGAGVAWDALVGAAAERQLWGIENLAGVPGTVGGATVQNIGAYGAELAQTFAYADVFDIATRSAARITRAEVAYAYRDSMFKHNRTLVVLRTAFTLRSALGEWQPNLSYKDIQAAAERGEPLTTPGEIGDAVRRIRGNKFPDLAKEGTAGSFFKNPVVARNLADSLAHIYPGLPQFAQPDGRVKLPLAWLLDHALALKGFAFGRARLFERQPLVIVVERGASADDVESLARMVEKKILDTTHIHLEREVETFTAQKLSTPSE